MTPTETEHGGRRRFQVTPETYQRVTFWALLLIGIIVVTGGAVRLTGSGLGCTDWPTCENNRIYPEWHFHGWVEFGNRLITGAVSLAVVAAVLASRLRKPRRRDLTWLSWGLVAGVAAQIVLGGVVVLSNLWPPFVMGHFILSQLLVLNAVILWHRSRIPDEIRTVRWPDRRALGLGTALGILGALAILSGTVVTGTGPHAGTHGDQVVERLPFEISSVVRLHGLVDFLVIVTILALVWRLRAGGAPRSLLNRIELVLVFGLLQAAIGYTQYLTGVPALLVTLHILGATLLWGAVVWLWLGLFERLPDSTPSRAQLEDGPDSSEHHNGSDRDRTGGDLVPRG